MVPAQVDYFDYREVALRQDAVSLGGDSDRRAIKPFSVVASQKRDVP
jgi:hypothetical protein